MESGGKQKERKIQDKCFVKFIVSTDLRISNLKTEAIYCFETPLIAYKATRLHIPDYYLVISRLHL